MASIQFESYKPSLNNLDPLVRPSEEGEAKLNLQNQTITCQAVRCLEGSTPSQQRDDWVAIQSKVEVVNNRVGPEGKTYVVGKDLFEAALHSKKPEEAFSQIAGIINNSDVFIQKESEKYLNNIDKILDSYELNQSMTLNQMREEIDSLRLLSKCVNNLNNPEISSRFNSICDKFSAKLISSPDFSPSTVGNKKERAGMAAEVRAISSEMFVGRKTLGMEEFAPDKAKDLILMGKKMDRGVHYNNIGPSSVRDNRVQIRQRNCDNQQKSEMTLILTPRARVDLESSLKALRDPEFIDQLSAHFGSKVTFKESEKIFYEISDATNQDKGVPKFHSSQAEKGVCISISLEGVGEVLIGNENQEVKMKVKSEGENEKTFAKSDKKEVEGQLYEVLEDTTGRYIPHHTVIARVKEKGGEVVDEAKVKKFHQLLSLVGLSNVLTPSAKDVQEKTNLLAFIDLYAPHLSFAIKMTPEFTSMSAKELRQNFLELLPEKPNTNELSRAEVEKLLNAEEYKTEECLMGTQNTLLSTPSSEMEKAGALGFFAGVANWPPVIVSVLNTGLIATNVRGNAGFSRPPSCVQDARSGGEECVFVRVGTRGMIDKMNENKINYLDTPWVQKFQAVIDISAANLPHTQRHHNSYGVQNPMTEILEDNKGQEKTSGTAIFENLDPISFTKMQNENPTLDNEIMLRTDSLDAKYITKVVYQDPRKTWVAYLTANKAPDGLMTQLNQEIAAGNHLSDDLKKKISDFLESQSLLTSKDGKQYPKGFQSYNPVFSDDIGGNALFNNPAIELKDSLRQNGMLEDGDKFRGMPFDKFFVEANTLDPSLFGK